MGWDNYCSGVDYDYIVLVPAGLGIFDSKPDITRHEIKQCPFTKCDLPGKSKRNFPGLGRVAAVVRRQRASEGPGCSGAAYPPIPHASSL